MVDGNQADESGENTNGDSNLSLNDIAERMAKVDAKILSPQQRAQMVLALIRKNSDELPSIWDTVCFAAEYIGSQVSTLPFLEDDAKKMLGLVYTFHYAYPATVDPTYPNDESNSNTSETQTGVADVGNNSGNESHS